MSQLRIGRDIQKNKAYKWETPIIARDRTIVPFDQLQSLVNYIWEGEGLKHPPVVVKKAPQQTTVWASATRFEIDAPAGGLPTVVLIHEIAHSMAPDHGHGPRWVGMYMLLLEKHCRLSMVQLMVEARRAGINWDFSGPDIQHHYALR